MSKGMTPADQTKHFHHRWGERTNSADEIIFFECFDCNLIIEAENHQDKETIKAQLEALERREVELNRHLSTIEEKDATIKALVEALEEQEERWGLYGEKAKAALAKAKEGV